MKPRIIFVGADKGGVGKTMVARALVEYLYAQGVKTRVFDGQTPGGDLVRFAPEATVVNMSDVQDQMRVFDGLSEDCVTVIDLPASMLWPIIATLDEAKLLDEVRSGEIEMTLLHVLGATVNSIAEITTAAQKIEGVKHLLVKNQTNDSQFFEWDQGAAKAIFDRMADVLIRVPQLKTMACEKLQLKGGTFQVFARDDDSRTLRGVVKTWLETVWAEFDRVQLLDIP